MHISHPTITEEGNLARYEVIVSSKYLSTTTLFYELDKEYSDMISDASDAALVGLLLPAMLYGEEIEIQGEISMELYFNVSYSLQKLLIGIMPFLNIVKISASSIVPLKKTKIGNQCATGFSAGIDSFCTLYTHFYKLQEENPLRITTLLFNNVGAHNHGQNAHQLFIQRHERIKSLAEKLNLPLIMVNSNLDDFYIDKKLPFSQTHTLRNVSVGMVLQKGLNRLLYSSSFSFLQMYFTESVRIGHSEIAILELLSTHQIRSQSVGAEYNRVEKTKIVSELKESYRYIDVCSYDNQGKTNCSKCSKCLRTLTTLDILNMIEAYSESFDMEIYKKNKNRFLGKVLARNSPYTDEIYIFAKTKGFSFTLVSYLYFIYYKLRYLIKKR